MRNTHLEVRHTATITAANTQHSGMRDAGHVKALSSVGTSTAISTTVCPAPPAGLPHRERTVLSAEMPSCARERAWERSLREESYM